MSSPSEPIIASHRIARVQRRRSAHTQVLSKLTHTNTHTPSLKMDKNPTIFILVKLKLSENVQMECYDERSWNCRSQASRFS